MIIGFVIKMRRFPETGRPQKFVIAWQHLRNGISELQQHEFAVERDAFACILVAQAKALQLLDAPGSTSWNLDHSMTVKNKQQS